MEPIDGGVVLSLGDGGIQGIIVIAMEFRG